MAATTHLEIVTPRKIVYKEDINVLEAPAIDGLIGILPRHAPLVTVLKSGVIKITTTNNKIKMSISNGFMEVKPDQINIVVETAELPEEIDVERARKARERAKKRLEGNDDNIDYARAEAALERAIARLKAVDQI